VTDRLRVDDELRLEVAHELRTHLEESAAELRAAGHSEDDAIAEASRALGSEAELAEQLWQANRRRVRRREVARWTLGATLGPAASVIAISAVWTTLLSVALLLSILSYGSTPHSGLIGLAGQAAADRVLAHIPEDERDLATNEGSLDERAARAETILDRSPNDPAAFAHYALTEVAKHDRDAGGAKVEAILPILRRGEAVEPENALYPLLQSAVLFEASTKPLADASPDRFEWRDHTGSAHVFTVPRYTVTNPGQFKAALAAFRSAAHKSYFDAHTMEAANLQLELLPSNSLDGQLLRISLACQILLPQVQKMRDAYEHIGSVALADAAKGDRASAKDWIAKQQRVAAMAIERSDLLVELISSERLSEYAIGQTALVLAKSGDHAGFEQERDRMIAVEKLLRPQFSRSSAAMIEPKFRSLSDSYFLGAATDLSRVNVAPHRSAE
jgi:hypothetical protein